MDGYWSAYPGGPPTGRFQSVFWPDGIDAQAITAGPTAGAGANITIKRVDGKLFDFRSFTGKLLANTAGAGGAFEIMPQLNGQDAFADPLQFDATGYAGMTFSHTPALTGYDTYVIHLWVDYALTALTLVDTNPVVVAPTNTIAASVSPVGAGSVGGAGDYPKQHRRHAHRHAERRLGVPEMDGEWRPGQHLGQLHFHRALQPHARRLLCSRVHRHHRHVPQLSPARRRATAPTTVIRRPPSQRRSCRVFSS